MLLADVFLLKLDVQLLRVLDFLFHPLVGEDPHVALAVLLDLTGPLLPLSEVLLREVLPQDEVDLLPLLPPKDLLLAKRDGFVGEPGVLWGAAH
eukprot:CAMPEP_0170566242 /NCGR_PEP_ID=MMETSP0211-20121228/79706_1 /TAXON_ID=311385 /ORGANISM="Pseudokeronopsis sp., Strain OXSARD2" /LENGTH=93 /DNA_ID=CAMNT_0010887349 /DNA_START=290 /DNA_END=571 /DNA_ORIENTATION=-